MTQSGDILNWYFFHYAACVPATHADRSSFSDEVSIPRLASRSAAFDHEKGEMSWNQSSVKSTGKPTRSFARSVSRDSHEAAQGDA
jgi:hypothetical protein